MPSKFLTKRIVLASTLLLLAVLVILARSLEIGLCGTRDYGCASAYDGISAPLLIFVPVLFFSLLTYFTRNEIFQAWMKFAIWWVPITVVLGLLLPSNDQSQSIGMGSTQGIIVLLMTFIFTIMSLVIIIAKWNSLKDKNSSAR